MFPSSVVNKKIEIDPWIRKTGKLVKMVWFGVLGKDAVSFEGQAIFIHT